MVAQRSPARWAAVGVACLVMGCAGGAPPRAPAAAAPAAPALATGDAFGVEAISDPLTRRRCLRLCRRVMDPPIGRCVRTCERIFRDTTAPGLIGDGQTGDGGTGDPGAGPGDSGDTGSGDGDTSVGSPPPAGDTNPSMGPQMPSRAD